MPNDINILVRAHDQASGVLGGIKGKADGLASSFASVGSKAALGLGAVGVAVGGLAALTGIKFNAMQEQSRVAFSVMLGSMDAAKARMAELSKFAAATPFELPSVVEASRILQTFTQGALATGEGLRLVGDIASGVSRPFEEVALWVGRMYDSLKSGRPIGEAAARLQEMGALSGEARARLEALAESGQSIDEIWPQVTQEFGAFNGMMEKQSHTMSGLWSTIKDTFAQTSGQVMAPFFDMMSKGMQRIVDITGTPSFAAGVERFAQRLGDATEAAAEFAQSEIFPRLQAFGEWLADTGIPKTQALAGILKDFFAPAVDTLRDAWANLQPQLERVVTYFQEHETAVKALGISLAALALTILALTQPWLAVVAVIAVVLAKWDEISHAFTVTVPNAIDAFLKKVEEIPILGDIVKAAVDRVKAQFDYVVAQFRDIIGLIKALIEGDWDRAWQKAGEIVTNVFVLIKDLVLIQLELLKGLLTDGARLAWEGFQLAAELVWGGLIKPWLTELPQAIAGAIGGLLGTLGGKGRDLMQGMIDGIERGWQYLSTTLIGLPNRMIEAVGDLAGTLYNAGLDLIQGLWDGVSAKLASFKGWLKGQLGNLGSTIAGGFGFGAVGGASGVSGSSGGSGGGAPAPVTYLGPRVASMAHGGYVPAGQTQLALLHGPEAVIPGGGSGAMNVTINIYGSVIEGERALAEAVKHIFRAGGWRGVINAEGA